MTARVLWLTKGLGRGGAERLLVGCAAHVSPQYDVEVAYVLPWKDALVPELRELGVRVHCLGGGRTGDPRWAWRLRRLLRERDYDLVHTHMPVPAVAARLLTARVGPPLVHTEHNVWQRYRGLTRWANAATYRRNAAVVAVSGSVAASIGRRRLPGPSDQPALTVVLHGIDRRRVLRDAAARDDVRTELGVEPDELVVGTVGNFTAKKDQSTLLRAHRHLLDAGVRARLVLVGGGPLEGALREQAAQLGTAGQVLFAGSRDDVPRILTGLDVFVLSSRAEGLPLSLMEAMAAGLPCVSTSVGGIPEIVTDGLDGRLVPPGDPTALADVLVQLAADEPAARRLGAAAAVRSSLFDVASAERRIEEVYERVLRARAPREAAAGAA
jgi:glycosyltransferase involved in cell wall biosynthesis